MKVVLYSKPGCHLCEGLQEKLIQIPDVELEIRNILSREDWFQTYQYEIPVLCQVKQAGQSGEGGSIEVPLPRLSPRASLRQLEQMLQKYKD